MLFHFSLSLSLTPALTPRFECPVSNDASAQDAPTPLFSSTDLSSCFRERGRERDNQRENSGECCIFHSTSPDFLFSLSLSRSFENKGCTISLISSSHVLTCIRSLLFTFSLSSLHPSFEAVTAVLSLSSASTLLPRPCDLAGVQSINIKALSHGSSVTARDCFPVFPPSPASCSCCHCCC